jgi:trigger factor
MEKVDIELPEGLSERQAGRILQRRASDMIMRGAQQEDIEQQLAELRAASKEMAQQELKTLFILDAVANKLDIEVNDQEVNGRVVQIAMQQGQRPQKVRDEMARNGQLQQLYVQIREEKAIEKILEQAKVTEITATEWDKKQGVEAKPKASGSKSSGKSDKSDDDAAKTTKKKTTKKKTTKKKSESDSDD